MHRKRKYPSAVTFHCVIFMVLWWWRSRSAAIWRSVGNPKRYITRGEKAVSVDRVKVFWCHYYGWFSSFFNLAL